MTTIIINEKTKKGRIVLDLIKELNCGKIIGDEKIAGDNPNVITRLAIQQALEGKTIKCANFDDYLAKVNFLIGSWYIPKTRPSDLLHLFVLAPILIYFNIRRASAIECSMSDG